MNGDDERRAAAAAQLEATVKKNADWFEAWHAAWDALEAQSACDTIGGAEYRRITAGARAVDLPASQVAMRLWIRFLANLPPAESITVESLRERAMRVLAAEEVSSAQT